MRAQHQIIFAVYAMLWPGMTLAGRNFVVLLLEVCILDCPKLWSGLLALAAARVLGQRLGSLNTTVPLRTAPSLESRAHALRSRAPPRIAV